MRATDDDWLAVADAFSGAAVDGSWLDALTALAAAANSRAGELIGLGSENTVPFNWANDLGPDWAEDFLAFGGGNPRTNPFVRAGTNAPVLKVLASAEFVTPEERRSNPFIAVHARRHDIPHICLTPLIKETNGLVGLAVIRSANQGEINAQDRAIFASIAPHVRAAVRTQIAIEHQGAALMAGALEAMSLTVFICDRFGLVKAMTPSAERLVSALSALRLRQGALTSASSAETQALDEAIKTAARGLERPGAPLSKTIFIRNKPAQPLVLDVLPIPRRNFAFGFDPRVLVVVRGSQPDPDRMQLLLRAAYGLTAAEADVTLRLVEGLTPDAIASARTSSLGTVRAQIRSIYDKLEVHRFSELVARLNGLR